MGAFLTCGSVADGRVIHVAATAAPGGDGSSWATALHSPTHALATAVPGDEIWVATGVYRPLPEGDPDSRRATFRVPEGVAIYGGFGGWESERTGRDPSQRPTILSGDLLGDDATDPAGAWLNRQDNCFHVITIINHVQPGSDCGGHTCSIDGFEIRAGHADGAGFGASTASDDQGSGINIFDACPRIENCVLADNFAANHGTINDHGDSTVVNCIFRNNRSDLIGGGLYIHHHSATVAIGCIFEGNSAAEDGGGVYCRSMPMHGAVARISGCVFLENTANNGAGMYVADEAAPMVESCRFEGNAAALGGGGVFAKLADPRIVDCTFADNVAGESISTGGGGSGGSGGGGVWNSGGRGSVERCVFSGNRASFGGGCYFNEFSEATVTDSVFTDNRAGEAGGLYALNSPVHVDRCRFERNVAAETSFSVGGGVSNYFSDSVVTRCVFVGNGAELGGGGVYCEGEAPRVDRCTFIGNTAPHAGAGTNQGWGGAVLNGYFTRSRITNCLMVDNTAVRGGAIYDMVFAEAQIVNCTVIGNRSLGDGLQAPSGHGYHADPSSRGAIKNCILINPGPDNGTDEIAGEIAGEVEVSYSCVRNGAAGIGNFDQDPLFSRTGAGSDGLWNTADDTVHFDRLAPGSPCVDAGDATALIASESLDLHGAARLRNDPLAPDRGVTRGGLAIDIGCAEVTCPADVETDGVRDGAVTAADVAAFMAWFESGDRRADVDGGGSDGLADGAVTVEDLLYFLVRLEVGC